jgi:hypothetical protein
MNTHMKMKLRSLFKFNQRNFCTHNPFHHDFHPDLTPKTRKDVAFIIFDYARVLIYGYVGLKLIVHSLSFIAFRKKKFLNNPDYVIVDAQTYADSIAKANANVDANADANADANVSK